LQLKLIDIGETGPRFAISWNHLISAPRNNKCFRLTLRNACNRPYSGEWEKKARDSIADVMGAECRRNVATLRGNHSLSREPLLVGRRLVDRLE